jgi:hypothetical protein
VHVGDTVLPLEDPGASPSILTVLLHIGLAWMVLRARWEGIYQKVDIAVRVEILAADRYVSVPTQGPLSRPPGS